MRKLLFFLCALLTGVGTVWADGPDVSGKSFTLTCGRGNVIGDGSRLFGNKQTGPSEFAIVEWDDEVSGGTFLYDVTNKAFIIHETNAASVNVNNNNCKESSTDFSMIIKGLQWKATNTSGEWHLTDENNFYLNMNGDVRMNTWRTADDGNRYTVTVVNESFDSSEAITMLEKYFDSRYGDLLSELIEEAREIVRHSGTPGYPTASAMSILQSVIDEANSASDKKSAYKSLREAIATALTDINYIPQTGKYYTIVNTVRGAMVYDPDHNDIVDPTSENANYLWYKTGELDEKNLNNLWGFVQDKDGNYYMYNAGKKQFATIGKGISGGPNGGAYGNGTWIFSNTPAYITLDDGIADDIAAPRVRVRATIATTGKSYTMSVSTGYYGPVIDYDEKNDGGVPMLFTEIGDADATIVSEIEALLADPTPYRKELQNTIASTESLKLGDELGLYVADDTYKAALAAAQAAVDNEKATIEDLTAANDALKAAIAGLQLNMPETGTFLRITGASGKSIAGGAMTSGTFSMTDATDATTIFYYDGTHLTNLGTGMNNALKNSGWNWVYGTENASEVTFGDGATNGGYTIKSHDVYMYDKGNESAARVDRGLIADANIKTSDVKYRSWELAYVNELPIALTQVGESYYATLCSPVALTIGDVEAYIATAASEGKLTLDEVEGTIPANEPVILVGTSATAEFAIAEGNTEAVTGNLLSGNATGGTTEANSILTLQSREGAEEAGFYVYTGTGIPAFKAYLSLESLGEAGIKGFTFDFGTTDGIATVEGETTEGAAIYNLAGQRVEKAVKGVYIINGKKVLVK